MWIQTFTKRQFFFDDPENEKSQIVMPDIVTALARKTRFLGHAAFDLKTAEHSVVVSYIVEALGGTKYAQLIGLMHDAHEAYTGDMTKPMKQFLKEFCGFDIGPLEKSVQERIYRALLIPSPNGNVAALVAQADLYALYTERWLYCRSDHIWDSDGIKLPEDFKSLYQNLDKQEAGRAFARRYNQLRDKGVV